MKRSDEEVSRQGLNINLLHFGTFAEIAMALLTSTHLARVTVPCSNLLIVASARRLHNRD